MKWTDAQLQTIETRGKNILVSAAAGSGKTAVLIERIKQLMLKDKVDIDRFLITTFTNAASAEMKERLEKAIIDEMKGPNCDRAFLKRQLLLLPSANISTFHTFALEVIKKYFYLTQLEPGFKIGDDTETLILEKSAIDDVFENRFENDYDRFTAFLKKYSSNRNENRLKDNLRGLYKEMRSIPYYFQWAEERISLLNTENPIEALKIDEYIVELCIAAINKAIICFDMASELIENTGLEKLLKKAEEDTEKIRKGINLTCDEKIEGFLRFYKGLKLNQMRAVKDEKEDFDNIKDIVAEYRRQGKKHIEDIYKKYLNRPLEEQNRELSAGYEDTMYMIELIKEMEDVYKAKKLEKNIIDFDDVMHYAVDILNDTKAADEYRMQFKYVFIDEYQDSNMLQETIASKVSSENNLFMVGDVKQSIYKFRLAEPELFKRKYEIYGDEEEVDSIRIDLNSNFRSKRMVTGVVNTVFSRIMEGYDEAAALKCTVDDKYPGGMPELHIIRKKSDENGFYSSSQQEIPYIISLIKENLGQEIYDTKKECYRLVEYKDITVLARNKAVIGEIEKALNDNGIPAYGENTGGYFETVELQVFTNLLKLIDNTRQDIPLISVMRCPIFNFTTEEMATIRISYPEGSYYNAVRLYIEDGDDECLREKTRALIDRINYWKALKNTVPLEELMRTLLYDTGYYDYCNSLPVGSQRTANLRLLVEKATAFEKTNYSGLYGFLSYIDAMKNSNISIGEAKVLGEGENLVKVMTVHKSKGLEFPIVILTSAGRQILPKGNGTSATLHKDFAVALPQVNKAEKWYRKTILQKIHDTRKAQEEYEEEIRILYVAMTRAMDRLLVTGVVKDVEKLQTDKIDAKSYIEMLYDGMEAGKADIIIHNGGEADYSRVRALSSRVRLVGLFNKVENLDDLQADNDEYAYIDKTLSYEYPYSKVEKIKSKYSVTELNKHGMDEVKEIVLSSPGFSHTKGRISASEIGTAMHLVMEKLDFSKAAFEGREYIDGIVEKLHSEGDITDEEKTAINTDNIEAFFKDPIGMRAASSKRLEKEREFIMEKKLDGGTTIVQGVIDCYFEDDDGLVLIDYKNSFVGGKITEEDIIERYRGQIDLYKEALEKAEVKPVQGAYLYMFELKKFIEIEGDL